MVHRTMKMILKGAHERDRQLPEFQNAEESSLPLVSSLKKTAKKKETMRQEDNDDHHRQKRWAVNHRQPELKERKEGKTEEDRQYTRERMSKAEEREKKMEGEYCRC